MFLLQTQAVIGWWDNSDNGGQDVDAFCGLSLRDDNWMDIIRIPVRAKLDMIIEETLIVERHLRIFERHYVDMFLIYETRISEIQVGIK